MNHEELVGKNFAWGAFSQIITRLFGLGFFVFMSYMLLEKGMGQYNFIAAFVPFWFVLSDFGISNYLYREWSKGILTVEQMKHDFNLILTMKFAMSFVIFIPFCIVNWFINNDIFFAVILYFVFVTLSIAVSQAETYLNSTNNFKTGAIRSLLEKLIIIIVGGVMLFFFAKVEAVFLAMIISQLASLYYLFSRHFPFSLKFIIDWKKTLELAKKGLPFVFFAIFIAIYGRIDMVMLRFMDGFEAVGWYGAGYKAYEIANIFPGVLFMPAIFPVLSRVYALKNRKEYKDFFDRSLRILFSVSISLSVFFIIFAPYMIDWFFPQSFLPSVLVVRIIVLVLTVSSLSWLFNNLLIIQNKEKLSLKIITISCLFNIVLNLFLIPKYSLYGAAWATVIAEALNLFLVQFFADWDKDRKMVTNMFLLVFTLVVVFSFMRMFGYMNNVLVGVGVMFFTLAAFWMLDLLRKDDIEMFYSPFKNKFNVLLRKLG